MIEELRKFIIDEYILKDKEVDADFYLGIIKIYSKYQGIEGYIAGVRFKEIEPRGTTEGLYTLQNHEITFDYALIEENSLRTAYMLSDRLSEKEQIWLEYFYTARSILHELTHVKQRKNCNSKSIDEIEGTRERILTEVDPTYRINYLNAKYKFGESEAFTNLREWDKYTEEKYGFDLLIERDAEIESSIITKDILGDLKEETPELAKFMDAVLYNSIGMGYKYVNDQIQSPAYLYAKELKGRAMIEKPTWYDENKEISLYASIVELPSAADRLKAGMPITPEEYLKFKRKLCEYHRDGYIVTSYGLDDIDQNHDIRP